MISQRSKFKLARRGFKRTILLVPGWAADSRIFASLDIDFNYLLPEQFSIQGFADSFVEELDRRAMDKVSVLGWSMGAFLASDLASRYPGRVEDVTFVGARRRYDKAGIDRIKELLASNRAGYLYKFYQESFSPEEKDIFLSFKRGLMKDYLREMPSGELITGLDYLSTSELKSAALKGVKARFIHGDSDRIAPVETILDLKEEMPTAEFIILKGAGHMPFLRDDFRGAFHGG